MTNNPKSRDKELVVQELGSEVLIYDLTIDKAYTLNETSSVIWRLCDGKNSVREIAEGLSKQMKMKVGEEIVWLALDNFRKDNLLADNEAFAIEFGGLSRRQVIKRAGLASLIALPLISGFVAPSAANAASGGGAANRDNGTTCTTARTTGSTECKSGRCRTTNVFNYNSADGSTSFISAGGLQCCTSGGGSTTGSYSNGTTTGICNLATTCCTGIGTESYDAPNNRYYCTCAATS